MPLTDLQQQALAVLDWLFDSSDHARRTGRSLVWGVALVRVAARNPGRWYSLFDHAEAWVGPSHRHLTDQIRNAVQELSHEDPRLRGFDEYRNASFRLNLHEPIPSWVPDLQGEAPMAAVYDPAFWESLPPGHLGIGGGGGLASPAIHAAYPLHINREGYLQAAVPEPPRRRAEPPPVQPLTAWERLNADDD